MKFFAAAIVVSCAVLGRAASAQTVMSRLPTPTPTAAAAASVKPMAPGVANILNAPVHSPASLDFGAVWNGQSSKRTFALTTNGNGNVAVEIPTGPYRVAEFREMGAGAFGGGGPLMARNVKSHITNPSKPWRWSLAPGAEIQIDLVFEPKFDLFSMTAGPKPATMKVTGPGPQGNWTLSVPLAGMFNGLKIAATFVVADKEPVVVSPAPGLDLAVSIAATSSELKGTIRGGSLPAGVSVTPVAVTVPPGSEKKVTVPLKLNWNGGFPADGVAKAGELVLEYGGGSQKASFSISGVPATTSTGGMPGNCGIDFLGWAAILYPDGRLLFSLSGNNFDLINNRNVLGTFFIGGRPVAWGVLHFQFGAEHRKDYKQWDNRKVNVDFDSRVKPSDYLPAVRGQVGFTCGLVGSSFNPPF